MCIFTADRIAVDLWDGRTILGPLIWVPQLRRSEAGPLIGFEFANPCTVDGDWLRFGKSRAGDGGRFVGRIVPWLRIRKSGLGEPRLASFW